MARPTRSSADGANAPVNGRSGPRKYGRSRAFEPAWTLVMLPGERGNVGEQYGRSFEHPLVASVSARHS
jgi:hypothetical protein